MSCENYTYTLKGWLDKNPDKKDFIIDAYNCTYGAAAEGLCIQASFELGWIFNEDVFDGTCTVTLPVTFGAITALFKDDQLLINWTTLSEVNNAYFEVEASTDGKNFVSLGKVQSLAKDGSSDHSLQYNFSKTTSHTALLAGVSALLLAIGSMATGRRKVGALMLLTFMLLGGVFMSSSKQDKVVLPSEAQDLYIRIKQVDKDGRYQYSKVVKVVYEN